MTISQCLYFSFDGQNSQDFNIINCKIDSGMYSEPFLAQRSIVEQKVRGRSPYFQEIEYQNLQFSLTFAYQSKWTNEDLRSLARWLSVDYYKPLIFYNDLTPTGDELIYYAMPVDASQIIHNGNNEGYITIQFRTNAPYGFSPVYISQIYDLSSNLVEGTTIEFENSGDETISPILYVKMISGTGFSIQNTTNGGQILSFENLAVNETLTIDCEEEEIISDISSDTYRFDNHNGVFLNMVRGINHLVVTGNVTVQLKYEFKFFQ